MSENSDEPLIDVHAMFENAVSDLEVAGSIVGCRVIHRTFGSGIIRSVINRDRDIGPPLIIINACDGDKTFHLHSLADPQCFTEVELPQSILAAIAPVREAVSDARRLEAERRAEAERQRLAEQEAQARRIAEARAFAALAERYCITTSGCPMERDGHPRRSSRCRHCITTSDCLMVREVLMPLISRIESGKLLSDEDILCLIQNKQFGTLAVYFHRLFVDSDEPWNLVKSCSYWRQHGQPEKAIDVSYEADTANWPGRVLGALLTTRAAAMLDCGYLDEAEYWVYKAIQISPYAYQPFNVLGRLFYMRKDHEAATECFNRAEELKECTEYFNRAEEFEEGAESLEDDALDLPF